MLDPTGKINQIDRFDYCRSYVLPGAVVTNIPRDRSQLGSYGAHEYARGLLIETAQQLGARPDQLYYTDDESTCAERWDICRDPGGCAAGPITLSVVALQLAVPLDTIRVTVMWFRSLDDGGRHEGWRLSLDGWPVPEQDRTYPPSPRATGALVARQHHAAAEARLRAATR